ncbi:MAG: YggS family pyridoxal phosphate-dependent enzyme [Gemmatimonadetes bacterium]|nr:YggS family pyridoxal phosphate-dependent enzyme [Gemmatimonadota bacterium]
MYAVRLRAALPRVQDRIATALLRSGRPGEVAVVAITKGHPSEAVEAALAVGLGRCGENRVQELAAKVEAVGRDRAEWHLVGHLQRNKVRRALELFDLIHSIDSIRLAQELSAEAVRAGREVIGLVQVNTSGEATKGGLAAAGALDAIAAIVALPCLRIEGLMTMAPLTDDAAVLRQTFSRARALLDQCAREVPAFQGCTLSMGMSNDYELAVEEGSTMVRLGTVLFGERLR